MKVYHGGNYIMYIVFDRKQTVLSLAKLLYHYVCKFMVADSFVGNTGFYPIDMGQVQPQV